MFTVDYFIKKFSAIPDSEWTVRIQQNELGQRCALGHCMPHHAERFVHVSDLSKNCYGHTTPEGLVLSELLGGSYRVACINNGDIAKYQQSTPKARILAALYDIKRKEQAEYKDITKELAILPVSETADMELV